MFTLSAQTNAREQECNWIRNQHSPHIHLNGAYRPSQQLLQRGQRVCCVCGVYVCDETQVKMMPIVRAPFDCRQASRT